MFCRSIAPLIPAARRQAARTNPTTRNVMTKCVPCLRHSLKQLVLGCNVPLLTLLVDCSMCLQCCEAWSLPGSYCQSRKPESRATFADTWSKSVQIDCTTDICSKTEGCQNEPDNTKCDDEVRALHASSTTCPTPLFWLWSTPTIHVLAPGACLRIWIAFEPVSYTAVAESGRDYACARILNTADELRCWRRWTARLTHARRRLGAQTPQMMAAAMMVSRAQSCMLCERVAVCLPMSHLLQCVCQSPIRIPVHSCSCNIGLCAATKAVSLCELMQGVVQLHLRCL